jgi:hypothetical protein
MFVWTGDLVTAHTCRNNMSTEFQLLVLTGTCRQVDSSSDDLTCMLAAAGSNNIVCMPRDKAVSHGRQLMEWITLLSWQECTRTMTLGA